MPQPGVQWVALAPQLLLQRGHRLRQSGTQYGLARPFLHLPDQVEDENRPAVTLVPGGREAVQSATLGGPWSEP